MRREWSVAIAIGALAAALALVAPSYFSAENLRDIFLVNMPVLVVAIGTTLVVLTGEIDISVGSAFAVCSVAAGGAVYATGSNAQAARLASIDTAFVKLSVFTAGGALTGLAALLNSVRFNQIPSNTGIGLEMKVIAAVVVGGAAITGGRGTFTGSVLGVMLLGAIGPALTFFGVSAQWERALQGAIILAAVTVDAARAGVSRTSLVGASP